LIEDFPFAYKNETNPNALKKVQHIQNDIVPNNILDFIEPSNKLEYPSNSHYNKELEE